MDFLTRLSPVHYVQIALVVLLMLRIGYNSVYLPLISGKIRAVIFPNTNVPRTYWVNLRPDGKFKIKGNPDTVYETDELCRCYIGMFRVPTFYYSENNPKPRNMTTGQITERRDAAELAQITDGHIASDAIRAVTKPESLNLMQVAVIICGVVVVTGVLLYMQMKEMIEAATL